MKKSNTNPHDNYIDELKEFTIKKKYKEKLKDTNQNQQEAGRSSCSRDRLGSFQEIQDSEWLHSSQTENLHTELWTENIMYTILHQYFW